MMNKEALKVAQLAQMTIEGFASSQELRAWHELCEELFGTKYPLSVNEKPEKGT